MMDTRYLFTLEELDMVLEKEKAIIIYGAGDYGKRTADHIISRGKASKIQCFYVTKKGEESSYRGIDISEPGKAPLPDQDALMFVAVSRLYLHEVLDAVQRYSSRCVCATQELYDAVGKALMPAPPSRRSEPFEGLDLLVSGFFKCGTSSLYKALAQIDDIYLSKAKESLYFSWCDDVDDPREKLERDHFGGIQRGQLVGAIEPSFYRYAERIQDVFGDRAKILFLVRDPVDGLFSHFKMFSRHGGSDELKDLYQKFGGSCSIEVFEAWSQDQPMAAIYRYIDWIQQYLEHFPQERIKIVIFEEMIKDPQRVVNEILQFIGSHHEYTSKELPWTNEGKFVMADIEGLEIAGRWNRARFEYRFLSGAAGKTRSDLYSRFMEVDRQYDLARKIYDLKLPQESRKKLEKYYEDSVRALEKLLDKDLSKIWF